MHWATEYVGRRWSATGNGPDCFHCWSFVRWVQRVNFGRTVSEIPTPETLLDIVRLFRGHPELQRWRAVDTACEGDCVLMRQARYPVHVGVWVDVDGGGVLHCVQGHGVIFQSLADLQQSGWNIHAYYRFQGSGS